MSDALPVNKILHLVLPETPEALRAELACDAAGEVYELTEASAREALAKIFAARQIAFWGVVDLPTR